MHKSWQIAGRCAEEVDAAIWKCGQLGQGPGEVEYGECQ